MTKRLLLAVTVLFCALASAQTTVSPLLQPRQFFPNSSGLPCSGCLLYSYVAGTTTPLATYSDSSGSVQNTNPVVLSVAGSAQIWMGSGSSYKFVLKDSLGNTVWTEDNVSPFSQFMPTSGGTGSPKSLAGVLYADQYVSGSGNNGIANALGSCGSYCDVLAPPTYGTTESQPFGGYFNGGTTEQWRQQGPAGFQPMPAQVLDQRYGVPQWLFNSSIATDNRHYSSPEFVMNGMAFGQGLFPHGPNALSLLGAAYLGGRNFGASALVDKATPTYFEAEGYKYTNSQANWALWAGYGFANGDNVAQQIEEWTYGGCGDKQDECGEAERYIASEGPLVFSGTLSSKSTASDGTTTFVVGSQSNPGTEGEDRQLIDTTQGTRVTITQMNTGSGPLPISYWRWTVSGVNIDSTFGTSSYASVTANVNNGASQTNTFPQSNVTLQVGSWTGTAPSAGSTVCMWEGDVDCEKVTATGAGTVTVATLRRPVSSGDLITTGGLTGQCIEAEADRLSSSNMNGVAGNPDTTPTSTSGTIRACYPIVANTAGNVISVAQSIYAPGNGAYTRAYQQMGSGGTVTLTVSGGSVTACSASGGSGYSSSTDAYGNILNPPVVSISGTWTTAPSVHISGIGGGALTACAIDNAGTGVTAATATVVPTNWADIYPTAKIVQVYDPSPTQALCPSGHWNGTACDVGVVDGTITTEPPLGTFNTSDNLEVPHYPFQQQKLGLNQAGTYIPANGNQNFGYDINLGGVWKDNDIAQRFTNLSDPSIYSGNPLSQPYTPGRGQLRPPWGTFLIGPFSVGLGMDTPPSSLGQSGFYGSAAIRIGCGETHGMTCAMWKNPYAIVRAVDNGSTQSADTIDYNPSTRTFDISVGADSSNPCKITVAPGAFTDCNPKAIVQGYFTNLVPNSQNMTAGTWTSGGATITASSTDLLDPWGGNTANKVVFGSVGINVDDNSTYTFVNGTQYKVCAWITSGSQTAPGSLTVGIGTNGSVNVYGFTPQPNSNWQWSCTADITATQGSGTYLHIVNLGSTGTVYFAGINVSIDNGTTGQPSAGLWPTQGTIQQTAIFGVSPSPALQNSSPTFNNLTVTGTCTGCGSVSAFVTTPAWNAGGSMSWAPASGIASLSLTATHGTTSTLNLSGLTSGGQYTVTVLQDATGGGTTTLNLGTGCTWLVDNSTDYAAASSVTVTATANDGDVLSFTYDGTRCWASYH